MIRVSYFFDGGGEERETFVKDTFLPLLRDLPGVQRVEAYEVIAMAQGGIPARFVLEVTFADEDAMNSAFASAEGRRISREIMNSAGDGMEMMTARVL